MEDIDGGLHPAVDGQSLDEDDYKVVTCMSEISQDSIRFLSRDKVDKVSCVLISNKFSDILAFGIVANWHNTRLWKVRQM